MSGAKKEQRKTPTPPPQLTPKEKMDNIESRLNEEERCAIPDGETPESKKKRLQRRNEEFLRLQISLDGIDSPELRERRKALTTRLLSIMHEADEEITKL